MADPFREQKIQNWAAEFAESEAVQPFPQQLRTHAVELASTFLLAACQSRNVEPDALTESDIKVGLLEGAGRLAFSKEASMKVPDFCAAFLEMLRQQGRIPGGRSLPSFVRALRIAFSSRAATSQQTGQALPQMPKQKPIERPGSKLSPNDPCPCGSGKKYKKCCKRLLG